MRAHHSTLAETQSGYERLRSDEERRGGAMLRRWREGGNAGGGSEASGGGELRYDPRGFGDASAQDLVDLGDRDLMLLQQQQQQNGGSGGGGSEGGGGGFGAATSTAPTSPYDLWGAILDAGLKPGAVGAGPTGGTRRWLHINHAGEPSMVEVRGAAAFVGMPSPARAAATHADHPTPRHRHLQVDKHELVQVLAVRYRDLLSLDPAVPIPFPAAILIRPRALVVNLETVRLIGERVDSPSALPTAKTTPPPPSSLPNMSPTPP